MKTLLLLRHAKASRDEPDTPDHDRPLKSRGKEDAKRLGRRMHAANLAPTLIVSSTARRALKTASRVAKRLDYSRDLELTDRLYLSSPQEHLVVARALPDTEDRVLFVGHNPGLSQFLSELTDMATELSTCEMAQLELPIDRWCDLSGSDGAKLVKLWQPEESD
jgi:phosphohistidine phosphatase